MNEQTNITLKAAPAGKRKVSVTRPKKPRANPGILSIRFELAFDPHEIGDERARRVWEGLGQMLSAALDEDGKREFLSMLQEAREKLR